MHKERVRFAFTLSIDVARRLRMNLDFTKSRGYCIRLIFKDLPAGVGSHPSLLELLGGKQPLHAPSLFSFY